MEKVSYRKSIIDAIKLLDTEDLTDVVDKSPTIEVKEKQKVYFWIRLYIKEPNENIQIGDDISITWKPSGEKLTTKFFTYGKKGSDKEHNDDIVNYNPEEDKKILCLMIEESSVNFNDEIPFIRTLFKNGYHFEYQLVRRDELVFINDRTGEILDYIECDF